MLSDLRYRWRSLFRRDEMEDQLAAELDHHVEHQAAIYMREGMTPEAALRRARIELGGVEHVKEECRRARGVSLIETMLQDSRYALRGLIARPGFTVVALATFALGIGSNAAVFSVFNAVLIRPLPFEDPDRLVAIWPTTTISNADLVFLQERARGFEQIAAFSPGWGFATSGTSQPLHLNAARVSTNFFTTLGVDPAFGRGLRPGESARGAWGVIVLSHQIWVSGFGADSAVVGRTIALGGEPHTIIGVMPRGFEVFYANVDAWIPLQVDASSPFYRGATAMGFGRIAPGTSIQQGDAELRSLIPPLRDALDHPDDYGRGFTVVPLHERLVGRVRPALLVLLGAVGFIVLIAGANIGNLLLVRGAGRRREVVVRAALGATRGRIVRQLMIENLILALAGGTLGVLAGVGGVRVLRRILPEDLPRLAEVGVDPMVLAVCGAVTIVIALVFGVTPAIVTTRVDPQHVLRGSSPGGGTRGSTMRGALIVAEVSLSLVLSVGAGLMLRTIWRLEHVDPGFRPQGVLSFRIEPTLGRVGSPEAVRSYYEGLLGEIAAVRGVERVGGAHHLPLSGFSWNGNLEIEGRPFPAGQTPPRPPWRIVVGDYFETMGIPIVRGRGFTADDRRDAPPVIVINEAMASRFWPDTDPLGVRIKVGGGTRDDWATIVGISRNVRYRALDAEIGNEVYRPIAQQSQAFTHIVVRTRGDPAGMFPSIRDAIRSFDSGAPISNVVPLDEIVARSFASRLFVTRLLVAFAAVGLLLGAVGIYGVVSFAASQRTRELGIRAALGAARPSLVRLLVRDGSLLALAGVAIGTLCSLAAAKWLEPLVFEVPTTDPATYAALAGLMLAVAIVASYIPARRAARVDPIVALRDE